MATIDYTPDGAVLAAYLRSNAFMRLIFGPFGSGKTSGSCVDLFRRGCEQRPFENVRRTRWLVVRNSYPRLMTTTIPSYRAWFDERFGRFNWTAPVMHRMVLPLDDGTVVDMEVLFVALDNPDGQAALKGFEPTGILFNEVSEIPRGIVNFALGRVGRYPPQSQGGPSWYGVLADSNQVDADHWLAEVAATPPEGWEVFMQPGGVIQVDDRWVENPEAENLKHLPAGYYRNQMGGQSEDFIRVYLGNLPGFVQDGKPVYPEFNDRTHVAAEPFGPIAGLPLYVGLDFGLTPAAVMAQRDARGRWFLIDEFCTEDMGVQRFAELLSARLEEWFSDVPRIETFGDPAGNQRAQTDEQTCFQMMREHANMEVRPAPSQDLTLRRVAVVSCLTRLIDGKPGLLVSPACKTLRTGFQGAYCYRRMRVTGDERYTDKPDKNRFSHPHDALQYLLSGAGEGRAALGKQKRRHRPKQANSAYAPHRWRAQA